MRPPLLIGRHHRHERGHVMKVGIVGAGAVGAACAMATLMRGCASELLVVTDPPDPLAYLTRELAGHERVLSTGTLLDSLRFRVHLGRRLGVAPTDVEAHVLGEHGTSQIFHWSGARIGGVPISDALEQSSLLRDHDVRTTIENEVRYANITIIEGIGA